MGYLSQCKTTITGGKMRQWFSVELKLQVFKDEYIRADDKQEAIERLTEHYHEEYGKNTIVTLLSIKGDLEK